MNKKISVVYRNAKKQSERVAMDFQSYIRILSEWNLFDIFLEKINEKREKGEIVYINEKEFLQGKCIQEEECLKKIVSLISEKKGESYFELYKQNSPNIPFLLFFGWILLCENQDDDIDKADMNRVGHIYESLKKHCSIDSKQYEPDEILSLYREIVLYCKIKNGQMQKRLTYQEFLDFEILKIENTESGEKLRKAKWSDWIDDRHSHSYWLYHHGISGKPDEIIVESLLKAAMKAEVMWAQKTRLCTLEEEKQATEYLEIMNILLQTCMKQYY